MARNKLSRRKFASLGLTATGAVFLAACGDAGTSTSSPTTAPVATTGAAATTSAAATTTGTAATTSAAATTTGAATTANAATTGAAATSGLGSVNPKILAPAKKYSPVIEILQSPPFFNPKLKSGETHENNVATKFLEDQMGIHYKYAWEYAAETNNQKWTQVLTGGDFPEFMTCVPTQFYTRLLKGNQLEDITDIWESTASDATKKKTTYPDGPNWSYVKANNRVMGIPFANATAANDMTMWIRKDWLDKVGAQPPKTFDELAALGKTFVSKGLAKMGLAVASDPTNGTVTYLGSLDPVYGSYGVMPTYWQKGSDGKLVYGSIQPGVKDALTLLQKWYKDGVIEKEFFTVPPGGDSGVGSKIVNGEAGIIFGPYWYALSAPDTTKKNDPNAEFAFYDLPTGPSGKAGRSGTATLYGLTGFKKGIDKTKVEAVIQQLNWIYARFDQQLENRDYFSPGTRYLFEGYDYVVQGDTIKSGDYPTWNAVGGADDPTWRYPASLADYNAILDKIAAKDKASLNPIERYLVSNPSALLAANAYNSVFKSNNIAIPNAYRGIPTPTQVTSGSSLSKLEAEAYARIISGQDPISAFDTFVQQWRSQGGDKITEEVNAASSS